MKLVFTIAAMTLVLPGNAFAASPEMTAFLTEGGKSFEESNVGTYPATRTEFTKCAGYWHKWSQTVTSYAPDEVAILPDGLKPDAAKARMASMQKVVSNYVDGSDPTDVKAFNGEIANHYQNAGFGLATALLGGDPAFVFGVLGSCGEPR